MTKLDTPFSYIYFYLFVRQLLNNLKEKWLVPILLFAFFNLLNIVQTYLGLRKKELEVKFLFIVQWDGKLLGILCVIMCVHMLVKSLHLKGQSTL